ncbi:hypothetical protein BLGI_4475 [Brevibacillus laterosporus GI-9]|uniref:AAA family ATPase n=1 Tax=Brevibacillus laterosporus TaxID=1465 RepID=UPI00024051FF|nr:MinD/ParA family protein [Brevibacillus laterosporus]CCF16506.1 hypothetical protein BLGI_4475 [Brevibacillus laterosporus GI-9]
MQKVTLATGSLSFDELLAEKFRNHFLVSKAPIDLRKHIRKKIDIQQPDILILHDKLISDYTDYKAKDDEWISIIEDLRINNPKLRVVFFCVRKINDPFLIRMINLGVYDIFIESRVNTEALIRQLSDPASYANVNYIKNNLKEKPEYGLGSIEEQSESDKCGTLNHKEEIKEIEEIENENDLEDDIDISEQQSKKNLRLPTFSFPKLVRNRTEIKTEYRTFATKVITITSMKGGVGKTEISLSLAAAIKGFTNCKVAVIDFSFPYGGVAQAVKMPREKTLADWLLHQGHLKMTPIGIAERTNCFKGIDIIPMPLNIQDILSFNAKDAEKVIDSLKMIYDVIIIDTNGFSEITLVAVTRATETLLVVTNENTSIFNSLSYKNDLISLYGIEQEQVSAFINMVPEFEDIKKEDIAEVFEDGDKGIPIIGFANYEDDVRQYRNEGKILYQHDPNHSFSVGIEMILAQFGIVSEELLEGRKKSKKFRNF